MKMTKRMNLLIRFVCIIAAYGMLHNSLITASLAAQKADEAAKKQIQSSIQAMGGEQALRGLKTLKMTGISHLNLLEQSERPDGPWLVQYQQFSELRDLENNRARVLLESSRPTPTGMAWAGASLIVADGVAAFESRGKLFPSNPQEVVKFEQKTALAPERVLFTALESADLRMDKDTVVQSVPHKVVKFRWKQIPVTLFINANSNLPTAVETVQIFPNDFFWGIWGDVSTRTFYSYWTLEKGGVHYPHQWDVYRNNQPLQTFTVMDLTVNAEIPANSFALTDEVKAKFKNVKPAVAISDIPVGESFPGTPQMSAQEIAPNIINLPGRWYVTLVKQTDGIVIVEAPISSGFSSAIIAETEKRFPNEKIKAVITTSDAFPHLGGVREYAARGIPIYALDVNRPILERLINAPFTMNPDLLSKNPRKAKFNFVSGKTVIGSGANRLEIYPVRTETGERMMMVYFPEYKLLYGSDLVQKQPDNTYFMPQYLSELMDATRRENLPVENVFAMHMAKTPWAEITSVVEKESSVNK